MAVVAAPRDLAFARVLWTRLRGVPKLICYLTDRAPLCSQPGILSSVHGNPRPALAASPWRVRYLFARAVGIDPRVSTAKTRTVDLGPTSVQFKGETNGALPRKRH